MSGNTLKFFQNWILLTQSICSSFRTFIYIYIFIDFAWSLSQHMKYKIKWNFIFFLISLISLSILLWASANWCAPYNNSRYERFLDYWFAIQLELNDSRVDKNMPKHKKNVKWQNAKNQQFIVNVMFFNAANQHLVIFARLFAFHYIFIKTCNLTSICCLLLCALWWMYVRIQANYKIKLEHFLEKWLIDW